MFGSEVLDAAAIGAVAALLGGIFAGFFNLLTKRTENKIKSLELTYNERMKSFTDMIAAMADTNNRIDMMYRLIDNYDHETAFMVSGTDPSGLNFTDTRNNFASCKRDFLKVYDNNRLYLPINIDKKIKQYIDENLDLPFPHYDEVKGEDMNDYELNYELTKKGFDMYLVKIKPTNDKRLESIILEMQKFIGFK